ncbi:uncharacterized protein LOC113496237 [Trichoplusia ni]|uniref:Uncharacterized protein LOC113496237 n=1 Tax=Trichoplusia ni TaxID=7111 RepID=A0A7E5VS76_TRINI|nr:uncharacterized protein LOC113496237 [Trichoplusia ni]
MCYYIIFVVFSIFVTDCTGLTPQCRNEKGEPVDWFYVYKLPREKNHLNPLVRRGVAYMHLTPSKLRGGWIMSDLAISDPRSMVGKTLSPLYQDRNIISLIYNDQPPATEHQPDILQNVADMYSKSKRGQMKQAGIKKYKKFKLGDKYYDDYDLAEMCKMHSKFMKTRVESGHTKGVILGDKFTSLWLVHSVPRFPPIPDLMNGLNVSGYDYPSTGMKYGQSFLCVSVQTSTLNQIATQLKYNEPLLVYSHIPQEFDNELPNLVDVVRNKTIDASPWYHIESFETLVGRKFLSFAKSAMFNDDLYSGLVAEVLQSDLLVESWTNGPGTLDSECSRNFQVRNIERLKFPIAKMSFTSHNDHSKWAVAVAHKMHNSQDTKVADYWVCVGDINRALPQESRGGGTVCTSGPILWGNFAHLIESVQTWYMYKPPSNVGPKLDSGINFSYITPEVAGRWTPSKKHIFSNSMLRHTLMPMYNSDYTQYMALLVYNEQQASGEFKGSASLGIMMANEMGGVWVGHTVPGFPDLTKAGPTFPSTEIKNGHILMCLSMDLITLNNMAIAIKQTEPAIKRMFIPEKMKNYLPEWENLVGPGSDPSKMSKTTVKKAKLLHFVTRGKSLRGLMLARSPGDSRCLYKSFAKTKHIVMDVYGHAEHTNIICDKKYSLRNINSISIKYPEQVYYINNKTDSMGFAVSTAARWQRTGNRKPQYWTCTGNIENQPLTAKGGIIACVNNYNVWLTFDNLKVKEPDCGFIVQ